MSGRTGGGWRPDRGTFGMVTGIVYRLVMVELGLLVATLPGTVGILLLTRDPSNIPLYALCAVPVGPALAAAVYALRSPFEVGELDPWRGFWRGWRTSLRQSLLIWVPALLFVAITGFNLAFSAAAGVDPLFAVAGAVVGAAVLVSAVAALVVVSRFRFRTIDVVRVTLYGLGVTPLVTLGLVALIVVAMAVVALGSDWVLALLGSVFALSLVTTTSPLRSRIERQFVAE